jgi:hypothetical protein
MRRPTRHERAAEITLREELDDLSFVRWRDDLEAWATTYEGYDEDLGGVARAYCVHGPHCWCAQARARFTRYVTRPGDNRWIISPEEFALTAELRYLAGEALWEIYANDYGMQLAWANDGGRELRRLIARCPHCRWNYPLGSYEVDMPTMPYGKLALDDAVLRFSRPLRCGNGACGTPFVVTVQPRYGLSQWWRWDTYAPWPEDASHPRQTTKVVDYFA